MSFPPDASAPGPNPRGHGGPSERIDPLEGGADPRELRLGPRTVTVVDQTNTANPTSIRAALESFRSQFPDRRRVLVLGDMLELGDTAEDLHRGLLDPLLEADPEAVVLVGPQMGSLWAELPDEVRLLHCLSATTAQAAVPELLQDGDALFVKASRGVGLEKVVSDWKSAPQPPTAAWRLVISGSVQRVGYRKWAQERAREHGVDGWIRNRSDGKVEARIQGDTDMLGRFVAQLHDGPRRAQVTRVATRVVEPSGVTGFSIRSKRTLEQPEDVTPQRSRARRAIGGVLAPVRRRVRRRT